MYMPHLKLFIHSSINGHLNRSYLLVTVDNAAVNIDVQICLSLVLKPGIQPTNLSLRSYYSTGIEVVSSPWLLTIVREVSPYTVISYLAEKTKKQMTETSQALKCVPVYKISVVTYMCRTPCQGLWDGSCGQCASWLFVLCACSGFFSFLSGFIEAVFLALVFG